MELREGYRNEEYQKRNIAYLTLAAGLFLLVGILQYVDDMATRKAAQEMISLAAHFVLLGLAIFWVISAESRVTSERLRSSAVLLGLFVVAFLLLRFVRYKFCKDNDIAARYLWYAYYIPQTAIPAIMLSAAFCIGNGEKKTPLGGLRWLLIPAALMILLIMTNDLHGLAFRFRAGFVDYETDYTHGPLYYVNIAWQLILSVFSVGIIFRRCRIQQCKACIWFLIAGLAVCVTLIVLSFFNWIRSYKTPELFCLFYIFLFECSIQLGLIPSNGNYPRYFAASGISAFIVDDAGQMVFQADHASLPFEGELKELQDGAVSEDGNTVLHAQDISGGRILWTDDLTHINEINAQIREIQENLSEEIELIRAENELKEQQTKIAETRRLYREVELAVYPQAAAIQRLVRGTHVTDADFRQTMCRVGVLGAYVKRRSNLTMMAEKEKKATLSEVGLSIKESLVYLTLGGVHCAFQPNCDADISSVCALAVYDAFEYAIERVMAELTDLSVYLGITDGRVILRLAMEGRRAPAAGIPPAPVTVTEEDGTVFLQLRLPKGVEP